MKLDFITHNRQLVVFKMLANSNRLKILKLLIGQKIPMSVTEISDLLHMPQPKISDHLKLLRIHKILKAKQDGTKMLYSLKDPAIVKFLGVAL